MVYDAYGPLFIRRDGPCPASLYARKEFVLNRLKRIHVNRHTLASNKKHGVSDPAIGVEESGCKKRYGSRIDILYEGVVVASVIHRENRPLKCGARCWIETRLDICIEGESQK